MEIAITVAITMLTMGVCFIAYLAYRWRQRAMELTEFVQNPNVTPHDREQDYKDSYEAKVNALESERRMIHESTLEVFDLLNERDLTDDIPLQQARNVLLRAISTSTYGRGDV